MNKSHLNSKAYWILFVGDKVVRPPQTKGLAFGEFAHFGVEHGFIKRIEPMEALEDTPVFLVDLDEQALENTELEEVGLRRLLMEVPTEKFGVVARAWQILHFLRTHQFCGRCGHKMEQETWELAMHCHNCHHRCYPRISPCIIVAIVKGNQILLAQGEKHRGGMYSILAGFVESGESLEQAVHREVMEEVGVEVTNLRYFGSQPWPFPHSLMVGYLADYQSGDIQVDGQEILTADWFSFDALPVIPPKLSIAGRLIEQAKIEVEAKEGK